MKSILYSILIACLFTQSVFSSENTDKRQILSCLSCISAVTTCASTGCAGFVGCVGCVTGIAAGCGACANDLCSASRFGHEIPEFSVVLDEPKEKLSCLIPLMNDSLCDFHCRCRYSKRGTCSSGTCYCR